MLVALPATAQTSGGTGLLGGLLTGVTGLLGGGRGPVHGVPEIDAGTVVVAVAAVPALAQSTSWSSWWDDLWSAFDDLWDDLYSGTPVDVPEIDGSTGLLALAVIGAVLLFVHDRRRRRA
ncbi:MAG: VPEID-CTERM sorting domain-containing protein [Rhodobacterales bacterium]|nr:VPEID-CTERM sorting domain-containing protein [Rhodobacterales bacterium]